MNPNVDHSGTIVGWGVDVEAKNRPAYPKEKKPPHGTGAHWTEPERQITDPSVFKSIEYGGFPPVYGSAVPPTGLSGLIRRYAFRFSEGRMTHWLALMLADRVNVAEGILDDLSRGKIPNLFGEMGLRSEWKFNRKRFLFRLGIVAAAGLFLTAALRSSRRERFESWE